MKTEEKISEKDFVTYILKEDNITISIRYPKQSRLIKRKEILKKVENILHRI